MQLYLADRIQLFIPLKLMRWAKTRRRRNLSRKEFWFMAFVQPTPGTVRRGPKPAAGMPATPTHNN